MATLNLKCQPTSYGRCSRGDATRRRSTSPSHAERQRLPDQAARAAKRTRPDQPSLLAAPPAAKPLAVRPSPKLCGSAGRHRRRDGLQLGRLVREAHAARHAHDLLQRLGRLLRLGAQQQARGRHHLRRAQGRVRIYRAAQLDSSSRTQARAAAAAGACGDRLACAAASLPEASGRPAAGQRRGGGGALRGAPAGRCLPSSAARRSGGRRRLRSRCTGATCRPVHTVTAALYVDLLTRQMYEGWSLQLNFVLQHAALASKRAELGPVNQGPRQQEGVHSCSRLPASQMSAQYWRLHRASSAKDTPSLRLGLLLRSHSCSRSVQVLRHTRQVQHSEPAAGPG